MNKFIQLEYSWYSFDESKSMTDMIIVNLDYVSRADPIIKRIMLNEKTEYSLTEQGWRAFIEAVNAGETPEPTTAKTNATNIQPARGDLQ